MQPRRLHRMLARVLACGLIALGPACSRGGDEAPAPDTAQPAATPGSRRGPDGPVRTAISAASQPPVDPTVVRFAGLEAPKPRGWQWHPPTNPQRVVNYVVPGASGGNQAQFAVFRVGGGVAMNVARWEAMFATQEGNAVEAIVTEHEVDGMTVTVVELSGVQATMDGVEKAEQLFLGAMLEGPEGPVQLKLTGDRATVERHHEGFMTLLRNMRRTNAEEDDQAGEDHGRTPEEAS